MNRSQDPSAQALLDAAATLHGATLGVLVQLQSHVVRDALEAYRRQALQHCSDELAPALDDHLAVVTAKAWQIVEEMDDAPCSIAVRRIGDLAKKLEEDA